MQLQHTALKKILPLPLLVILASSLASCQIEREQAARLPDVKVSVQPGRLPEYNIQGPDVKVGVTERTVTVPKVVVVQEEQTIKVPYIDVDVPGAKRQEKTITTEVEVPSNGYTLNTQGIYVVNNQLWVVSRLQKVNPNAPKATVRVSDRVVVNAPDIPVRQFIIGQRPNGNFNEQYTFISDRQQIASDLQSGRQLYRKEATS